MVFEVYRILHENEEVNNLDKLYDKYKKELSTTDVVDLKDKEGVSRLQFLGLFGFTEIEEFDTNLINKK